jgi:hypothetical protein
MITPKNTPIDHRAYVIFIGMGEESGKFCGGSVEDFRNAASSEVESDEISGRDWIALRAIEILFPILLPIPLPIRRDRDMIYRHNDGVAKWPPEHRGRSGEFVARD